MKKPNQWFIQEGDSKYIIVHLYIDLVQEFLGRINKKHVERGDTEQHPYVRKYELIVNTQLKLAYVVMFFLPDCDEEVLDSYSRRLRRRYNLVNNMVYSQLLNLVETQTQYQLVPPPLPTENSGDPNNATALWLKSELDE